MLTPADYAEIPEKPLPTWARRAKRAHLNLVENLPVFATAVIVAHLAGAANETTAMAAATFFWAGCLRVRLLCGRALLAHRDLNGRLPSESRHLLADLYLSLPSRP